MKSNTRRKEFVICPDCLGEVGQTTDLKSPGRAGPWYCDACGMGWCLTVSAGGEIEIDRYKDRIVHTKVLLQYVHDPRFRIQVRGMRIVPFAGPDPDTEEDHLANAAYYYEEHTCVVNFLGCEEVFFEGDDDPHGLFKVISVEVEDGPSNNPVV